MSRLGDLLLIGAVFLLAFVPRASDLAVFATVDEPLWVARSIQFLGSFTAGDWRGTLGVGGEPVHPGVTTRWAGAAGIMSHYLTTLSWGKSGLEIAGAPLGRAYRPSMELLASARRPAVIVVALAVVATYLLIRSMVSLAAALLAVSLLALDTFYVGLSRLLHHDALSATFALLSALCLAMALNRNQRRWFAATGATAGLAFLSKSPSVVLLALVVAVTLASGALRPAEERGWGQLALGVTVCMAAAVVTVFVFWPAMWVDPLGTIEAVFHTAGVYAETAHESGNFFWGQTLPDPGALFYPVATLFRSSPLALVGAAVTLAFLPVWLRDSRRPERSLINVTLALWGLAAAYLVIFTLGAKKFDRYILPSILALDVLAGLGWAAIVVAVSSRWGIQRGRLWAAVVVAVLAIQSILCVSHHPYYLTYYNPALGGERVAAKVMLVGWGEGLDKVVRYLDSATGRTRVQLGAIYPALMDYLGHSRYRSFAFPPESWTDEPPYPWAQLDYAVVYLDALQRGVLAPRAFREVFAGTDPEYVARLNGVDYASLYRITRDPFVGLPSQALPLKVEYPGNVRLAGFRVYPTETTPDGRQLLPVTLYWQVEDPCIPRSRIALKLLNSVSTVWASSLDVAPWGYAHCGSIKSSWDGEMIFPDEHLLEVHPGTPPGSYQVEVILLDDRDAAERQPIADKPVLLGPVELAPHRGLRPEALDMDQSVDAMVGDRIRLLGFKSTGSTRAGHTLEFTAFWQCIAPVDESYTVFVHLVDRQGRLLEQRDSEPVTGFYPTNRWQAGEIVRDQYVFSFPDDRAARAAGIRIGMYRPAKGERLPVTLASGSVPEDRAVPLP